jgi:hypothetical protein
MVWASTTDVGRGSGAGGRRRSASRAAVGDMARPYAREAA